MERVERRTVVIGQPAIPERMAGIPISREETRNQEMNVETSEIRIDKEFRDLIDPLTQDEYGQLEANLLADGCRDPLVVWEHGNVLLDGHNRYRICREHRIPFNVELKEFPSRQHAIEWIINNQLGRRNLTPERMSYLRGKKYSREKHRHGGDRMTEASGQNDHLVKTHERLAKEHKVSPRTIRRDAEFQESVDAIVDLAANEEERDRFRQALLSGDVKIPKKEVVEIGKLAETDPEKARERISDWTSGKAKSSKKRKKEAAEGQETAPPVPSKTKSKPKAAPGNEQPVSKEEPNPEKPSTAMALADEAIGCIRRISPDDPQRTKALKRIECCLKIAVMETKETAAVSSSDIPREPVLERRESAEEIIRKPTKDKGAPTPECFGHYDDDTDECYRECSAFRSECLKGINNSAGKAKIAA